MSPRIDVFWKDGTQSKLAEDGIEPQGDDVHLVSVSFGDGTGELQGITISGERLGDLKIEGDEIHCTIVNIPALITLPDTDGKGRSEDNWCKEISLMIRGSATNGYTVIAERGDIPWLKDKDSLSGDLGDWMAANDGTLTHKTIEHLPWKRLGIGEPDDDEYLNFANIGLFVQTGDKAEASPQLVFIVVPVGNEQKTSDPNGFGFPGPKTLLRDANLKRLRNFKLMGISNVSSVNVVPVINFIQVSSDDRTYKDWFTLLLWRWHGRKAIQSHDISFDDLCSLIWNPTVALGRAGLRLTRHGRPWFPIAEIKFSGDEDNKQGVSPVLVYQRPKEGQARLRSFYPYQRDSEVDQPAYSRVRLTIPWQSEPTVPAQCDDKKACAGARVPEQPSALHESQQVNLEATLKGQVTGKWSENDWGKKKPAFTVVEILRLVEAALSSSPRGSGDGFHAEWYYGNCDPERDSGSWVSVGSFDIRFTQDGKEGDIGEAPGSSKGENAKPGYVHRDDDEPGGNVNPSIAKCVLHGVWNESECDLFLEFQLLNLKCEFRLGAGADLDNAQLAARFDEANPTESALHRESGPVIDPGGNVFGGRFGLRVRTEHGRNAVVQCNLERDEGEANDRSSFYFQARPFTVAYVDPPTFDAVRAGTDFAYWRSDDPEGAQWRVPDATMRFMFPPQAVGEEMERGKRFWNAETGEDGAITPSQYIDKDAVLKYRFSPPTTLTIKPSLRDRRYHPVPNNLGNILRQASVFEFATEMVYPLATHFKRDIKEEPDIRIAETSSFTGHPTENLPVYPGKASTSASRTFFPDVFPGDLGAWAEANMDLVRAHYVEKRALHSALRANFVARVAKYHLFDSRARGTELNLSKQLTFNIRAHPSADREERQTLLGVTPPVFNPLPTFVQEFREDGKKAWKYTKPDGDLSDKEQYLIATFLQDGDWGDENQGAIRAGIVHTLEFKSEVLAVLRNPKSKVGTIDALSFSTLGATGSMSVEFNEGRTTFVADVRDGQIERLVKTTIGRAGIVWNRCKHTIVYERTVVPSLQFEQQQAPMYGRPVIRKTAEYIEPLQPERAFDHENDAVKNRTGCLAGCEFVTPRIYVDGAWGRDLGHGYEIPLWNPRDTSGFYPKPDIALKATGAAGADSRQWISDPNEVVFYANMEANTGNNPDKWLAMASVDAPLGPHRVGALSKRNLGAGEWKDQLTGRSAGKSARAGGARRPRFDLRVTSEAAVNLQAQRGDTEMLARLDLVSIMRSDETSSFRDTAYKSKLDKYSGQLDTAARIDQVLARVRGFIRRLPEHILKHPCDVAKERVKSQVEELFDTAVADIGALTISADKLPAVPASDVMQSSLVHDLGNLGLTGHKMLARALQPLYKALKELKAADASARKQARMEIDAHWQIVEARFADAEQVRGRVIRSLDAGKKTVKEIADSIQTIMVELDSMVDTLDDDALKNLISQNKRLILELERVDEPRVRAAITALRDGLRQVNAFLNQAIGVADTAKRALVDSCKNLIAPTKDAADQLKDGLKNLIVKVQATKPELAVVRKKINDLNSGLEGEAFSGAIAEIETALVNLQRDYTQSVEEVNTAVSTAAEAIVRQIQSIRSKLFEQVLARFNDGTEYAKKMLNDLKEEVGKRLNVIVEHGERLCDRLDRVETDVREYLKTQEQILSENFTNVLNESIDEATRVQVEALDAEFRGAGAKVGTGIKLAKTLGEMPKLPQLTFNIDSTECVYDDLKQQIETSPFVARLKEFDGGLKELGLAVPCQEFFDQIKPEDYRGQFNEIFNNVVGADMGFLFKDFRLPKLDSDNIKITHGTDKATRTAWAKARVVADYPGEKTAFEFAGLAVRVSGLSLRADSEISTSLGSAQRSTTNSSLRSNWSLDFSGTRLVTFTDVTIRYDGHDFDFDLNPDKVQLHPSLKFISEIAEKWGEKVPPAIEIVKDASGMPTGARANLETLMDAPPPLGPVTIGPLRMGGGISLTIADTFELGAHVFVGRKQAPIFVQIGWLGGGLWVEGRTRLIGSKVRCSASVGMALGSMQSLTVAGIAQGSYSILLYTYLEMTHVNGSVMTVGMSMMGSARLLGVATAYISLLLEVTHQSGGGTRGTGVLEASVEICWCFTLRVNESVEQDL
ncbi:MAG: hypothetical protein AB2803_14480 [Candidatus Thiodiazotropha sp.]